MYICARALPALGRDSYKIGNPTIIINHLIYSRFIYNGDSEPQLNMVGILSCSSTYHFSFIFATSVVFLALRRIKIYPGSAGDAFGHTFALLASWLVLRYCV